MTSRLLHLRQAALRGGAALLKVRRQLTGIETYRQRRRTLTIRHISGHRLIALVEIASPANKDRPESVEVFVTKTVECLTSEFMCS